MARAIVLLGECQRAARACKWLLSRAAQHFLGRSAACVVVDARSSSSINNQRSLKAPLKAGWRGGGGASRQQPSSSKYRPTADVRRLTNSLGAR